MDLKSLEAARCLVRLAGETGSHEPEALGLRVERSWDSGACRSRVTNTSDRPVRLREVVLFTGALALPPETGFYGEGFQMLSQTGGTLGVPVDIGGYTDDRHYRLPRAPEMPEALTAYGLAVLTPPAGDGAAGTTGTQHVLLAFTSCRRFVGSFRFGDGRYEVVVDTEGLDLAPGATWELEEFWTGAGPDREALLEGLAARISRHHPMLPVAEQPAGWCSWYWYGPRIGERDILENMRALAEHDLPLRYVQIDDGFQAAMGDWLITGERFPGGMAPLCRTINEAGFEPAVWVAPFIAERDSQLARELPEWLVQSPTGGPLSSGDVSFGGWRRGPWYMLDGTHSGALGYIEDVFRTMRREWGCRYFKLDANTWGALHGGIRHDPGATRIEAYRRGMEAALRGAGADSFILGCNAPMWGSLGLVHGMRVSGDIKRDWRKVARVARECFARAWQHQRLWLNDPDCVVLANRPGDATLTDDEFLFHATAIAATGGLVLSGDSIPALDATARDRLARLVYSAGEAARFSDGTWTHAVLHRPDGELRCLFNWGDTPQEATIELERPYQVTDFWTGQPLGILTGTASVGPLPPHSARLLRLQPVS